MPDKLKPQEELELLNRWRDGDSAAGQALFRRCYRMLYYYFATKVDSDIDDLVQTTLESCLKGAGQFRGDATFRTYLFKIARNVLYADLKRRKKSRYKFDPSVSSLVDLAITPRTRLARDQQYNVLQQSLRSLSVDDQLLLEHRYWQNMNVEELADIFGITKDATYARLSRARKALGKQFDRLARTAPQPREQLDDLDSWARSVRAMVAEQ